MTQLKPILYHLEPIIPSSPGKFKSSPYAFNRLRHNPRLIIWSSLFLFFLLLLFFCSPPPASSSRKRRSLQSSDYSARTRPGPNWEAKARNAARPQSKSGFTVLVTGAAGFVGSHVLFTHANIRLARTELGYKPTTDLETGLKKFVKWYLDYYRAKKKQSSW